MWQLEHPVLTEGWVWDDHAAVLLWQPSQVVEYLVGFRLCEPGLSLKWQLEHPEEAAM